MYVLTAQRSLTYRAIAILLGCAIAFLGATTAWGMSELRTADLAPDNRSWIDLTIDEIRAFQHEMFQNAPDVEGTVTHHFTADEIYYLEPNLYLPDDTGVTSRADAWTSGLTNR